jgi:hypothetical protein
MQPRDELWALEYRDYSAALDIVTDIGVEFCNPSGNTRADIDPIGRHFTLNDKWRRSRRKPEKHAEA